MSMEAAIVLNDTLYTGSCLNTSHPSPIVQSGKDFIGPFTICGNFASPPISPSKIGLMRQTRCIIGLSLHQKYGLYVLFLIDMDG